MAQQQTQTQQDRERQERVKKETAEREKSNNPATKARREFGREGDAPGMHPANQPAPDTKETKGTRLDLEDVTGNPGHRGVNPDAPGNSINRGPNEPPTDAERRSIASSNIPIGSINEPPDVEPPSRAAQLGQIGSANEPRGSDVYRGIEGDGENTKAAARLGGQASTRGATPVAGQGSSASINEPAGSTIGSNMPGTEAPVVLSSIDPESAPVQAAGATFALTVHGEGFTDECVIVFNDEDMDTTYVSANELRSDATPVSDAPTIVDVEVANGEDLSEALTFEFTAVAGRASGKSARKPSKGKRDKSKAKSKSKR